MSPPRDRLPVPAPAAARRQPRPRGSGAPPPRLTCAACRQALPLETLRFDPGRQDVVPPSAVPWRRAPPGGGPRGRRASRPPARRTSSGRGWPTGDLPTPGRGPSRGPQANPGRVTESVPPRSAGRSQPARQIGETSRWRPLPECGQAALVLGRRFVVPRAPLVSTSAAEPIQLHQRGRGLAARTQVKVTESHVLLGEASRAIQRAQHVVARRRVGAPRAARLGRSRRSGRPAGRGRHAPVPPGSSPGPGLAPTRVVSSRSAAAIRASRPEAPASQPISADILSSGQTLGKVMVR